MDHRAAPIKAHEFALETAHGQVVKTATYYREVKKRSFCVVKVQTQTSIPPCLLADTHFAAFGPLSGDVLGGLVASEQAQAASR